MIFNDQNPGPTKETVTKILDLPYRNCNSLGNKNDYSGNQDKYNTNLKK